MKLARNTRKLSQSEVEERLRARGFSLVDQYVDTRSRCTLRCSKGHEWRTVIGCVIHRSQRGCPYCSKRARLTKEVICERLSSRGITLISENTRAAFKSAFRCKHGHEWRTRLGSVLSGGGCPSCSPVRPLTQEEVEHRIADRGFSIVSGFVSASRHAVFRCRVGHEWLAEPDNILHGKGCPHCAGLVKYTPENLNAKLLDRGIQLVGAYENANKPSLFRCKEGHEWKGYPGQILSGVGCPSCAKYGFQPLEPAYFYLVSLVHPRGDCYLGFGITKNLQYRLKVHAKAAASSGFSFSHIHSSFFESGEQALQLERQVKESFDCIDSGVRGFKKEALPFWSLSDVCALVGVSL